MFFLAFPLSDPCLNHHCKKGKVCELDENNEPMCVCQDPLTCPAPVGEFEHVSFYCSISEPTAVYLKDKNRGLVWDIFLDLCLREKNISIFPQHPFSKWNSESSSRHSQILEEYQSCHALLFTPIHHLLQSNRSVALTTRPMTLPATSLPQSALWRAPRRATSCTWTTSDPANVSACHWRFWKCAKIRVVSPGVEMSNI